MTQLVMLKMIKEHRANSLPTLFCNFDSKEDEKMIRGILIVKHTSNRIKNEDQLVIIDNPNRLTKNDILSKFRIDGKQNIEMMPISEKIFKYGTFISYEDYKKEYLNKRNQREKEIRRKNRIKKYCESNILTYEEVNKIYKYLYLPKDDRLNKVDFLEYYLYFGRNIERYKFYKKVKNNNVSWKEFRNQVVNRSRQKEKNKKDKQIVIEEIYKESDYMSRRTTYKKNDFNRDLK